MKLNSIFSQSIPQTIYYREHSFGCAVTGKTTNGNGKKSAPAGIQKQYVFEYVSLKVKAKQITKLKCTMFYFTVYGFNL